MGAGGCNCASSAAVLDRMARTPVVSIGPPPEDHRRHCSLCISLSHHEAFLRTHMFPPRFLLFRARPSPDCIEVTVGSSTGSNVRQLTISRADVVCPAEVTKDNWLGGATDPDTFAVAQLGTLLAVKRTDSDGGWVRQLRFKCCGEPHPPQLVCLPLVALRAPMSSLFGGARCPLISIGSDM